MKTNLVALLALAAMLSACGGGGGDDAPADEIVLRATVSASQADDPSTMRNDVFAGLATERSPMRYSGDVRYRTCVSGSWRQTLTSPTTLRLTVQVAGASKSIDLAGAAGPGNSIAFAVCGDALARTVTPVALTGAADFALRALDNRAAAAVKGYDVTADFVVTRLP